MFPAANRSRRKQPGKRGDDRQNDEALDQSDAFSIHRFTFGFSYFKCSSRYVAVPSLPMHFIS